MNYWNELLMVAILWGMVAIIVGIGWLIVKIGQVVPPPIAILVLVTLGFFVLGALIGQN